MATKVTKKKLETALETYAGLVGAYPDNEDYLQRYADMLQSMGRDATAIATLQQLHDIIAKRSAKEAKAFAKKHPEIGRVSFEDIFDAQDKHIITGKIIHALLGKLWLRIHQKKYKEGQAICRYNEPSDSLTLVLSGHIDVYAPDEKNNRVLLENVGIYDILGEQTYFRPSANNIDAFVSSESATVVKVPRKKILAMLEENKHLESMLKQRTQFRSNVRRIALHPIFKTLPLKLSKYLARYASSKLFSEKSVIPYHAEDFDGLFMLISGEACFIARDKNDKRIPLPQLSKHTLIGDLLLTNRSPSQNSELYAISKVRLLHLPKEPLLNLSAAFPPLSERLMQYAEQQQQHIAWGLSKSHEQ